MAGFNTVNGKYCCNLKGKARVPLAHASSFNTVNGKYCCNVVPAAEVLTGVGEMFQYRKR